MVDLTRDADGQRPSTAAGPGARPVREGLHATGSSSAATAFRDGCRSPPWTRSTATRTPSTTSSRTRSRSWTPSTSSSSAPRPSTRSGAGSSRRSTATAAARTTRSTGSGTSCAAVPSTSPTGSEPGSSAAIAADERHVEVYVAWQCAQQLRAAYQPEQPRRRAADRREDPRVASPTCPIPEIARLGRTLKQWREAFLAYFDTGRRQQRRHRSDQRPHRAPPPHRPRLPQPRQLPPTHAPHRRRTGTPPPQVRSSQKTQQHREPGRQHAEHAGGPVTVVEIAAIWRIATHQQHHRDRYRSHHDHDEDGHENIHHLAVR